MGFPGVSVGKESSCNYAGDPDSIPESGRSPGKGNGNPSQYSCLENHMDRGDWWDTACEISHVHGIPRIRHNWATKPPQPNLKVHFVVGSEYLILLTCQYSPNWSIYSTQAKSKCQKAFCTNRLPDSKLHMEMQRKSTHTTLKKEEQSWRAKTTWFQELL